MKMDRRQFLKAGIAGLAGIAIGVCSTNLLNTNSFKPVYSGDEGLVKEVLDEIDNEKYPKMFLEGLGFQGGYFEVPEPKEDISSYFFSYELPYYYHRGKLHIPSIQDIEKVISDKLEEGIGMYMNKRERIENGYFKITGKNNPFVEIGKKEVRVGADVYLEVVVDGKKASIDFSRRPFVVSSDLYNMNTFARKVCEYYWENRRLPEKKALTQIARDYDLLCRVEGLEENEGKLIQLKSRDKDKQPELYQFAIVD